MINVHRPEAQASQNRFQLYSFIVGLRRILPAGRYDTGFRHLGPT